jgi:hypothetical protein
VPERDIFVGQIGFDSTFMKLKHILSIVVLFTISLSALAQSKTGSVKGKVTSATDGNPIEMVTVALEGTEYYTSTSGDGFFSINQVPAGNYKFRAQFVGFESFSKDITIEPGRSVSISVQLKPSTELNTVEISGNGNQAQTNEITSVTTITKETITRMPGVGEPDFAQALQMVAGVISTGDQGGQLYIRGGTPVQNKLLLDGVILYNPFHSIGLFSVLETEIIRTADVYTGGFGAQYGGRISSIMDITTRDGNAKRFAGKVGANTFTSRIILEGPLKRATEKSKTTVSLLAAGKYSYLPQSSKALYSYTERGKEGLPFGFGDGYGKLSVNGAGGNRLALFGFGHTDQATFNNVSSIKWKQMGGGLNFTVVPGAANVKIDGNFGYSYYKVALNEENKSERSSVVNGFNFGLNFTSFFKRDRLEYGLETIGFTTDFQFYNASNRQINQKENTTEFAGYVRYRLNRGIFVFDPSFRLHYYASLNNVSPEPRLGIKVNVHRRFRLKTSGGMYSQNLIAANNDYDVVNLFYGFLSGSSNLPAEFNGKPVRSQLQKAEHVIFGFEWDIVKNLNLNVEGYYKNFRQLTNLNRFKIYDDNAANAEEPDRYKKDFIIEKGYAAGMDVTATYTNDRLFATAVYSLTFTERFDEIVTYFPSFDRRHNLNLLVNYKLGKKKNWEVSARFNFGSGFAFTQSAGYYQNLDFANGITTDYVNQNGDLAILLSNINGGRLPTYHRLDIGAKYIKKFNERFGLEISAGATNVYNRKNIFYVDRVTFKRVNQLPVLPYLGFQFSF